jgi:hypothetical protein
MYFYHWRHWFLDVSLRVTMACFHCHICNALGLCILIFSHIYVLPRVRYHICICDMFWTYVQNVSKYLFVWFLLYRTVAMRYYFVRASTIIEVLFSNGWRSHTSRCITCDRHASIMKTICFFEHTCTLPFINIQYGEKKVWYIIVHASTIIRRHFQMQLYGRTKSQHCNMTQCWSMDCSARSMMETSIDWK